MSNTKHPSVCYVVKIVVSLTDRAYWKEQCHFVRFLLWRYQCLERSSPSSSSPSVTSQASIDLFRPQLIASSKVFEVIFVHSVYNSALFWASCCCSFLFHAATNFISIFLVSLQLVLFPTLPKFLQSFCGQKVCTVCSSANLRID